MRNDDQSFSLTTTYAASEIFMFENTEMLIFLFENADVLKIKLTKFSPTHTNRN